MAIIENRSTEIGDIILIKTEVPIIGLIALQSFYDTTQGETSEKLFEKKFRYSIDGINFSLWIELTIPNIQGIQVQPTDIFYIEYHYKRIGIDPTGEISFLNNTLEAEINQPHCGDAFLQSIFAEFFDCTNIEMLNWCINVLEKLYKPGILPKYLERDRLNNYNREDEDFLAFWKSITCFFAMIVYYARSFENLNSNKIILTEYLKGFGFGNDSNSSLEDLQYLMKNIYEEISSRGTIKIIRKDIDGSKIDGELLRLINYKENDEFIFNLIDPYKIGWIIDQASPLYKGVYQNIGANKAYESTQDIIDLNKYPLTGGGYINQFQDGDKQVLQILNIGDLEIEGIGIEDFSKAIVVNPNISYEITFFIKQPISSQNFNFGVRAYDKDNNLIDLKNTINFIENNFCYQQQLLKNSEYYFIRGIIYKYGALEIDCEPKLNLGFGQNLKFSDEDICKIIPYIQLDNSIQDYPNELRIWDLKIKPLNREQELGFITPGLFLECWLKNNNFKKTEEQIDKFIIDYLIPYNIKLKNIHI